VQPDNDRKDETSAGKQRTISGWCVGHALQLNKK
jgi:hypothetical protein